MRSRTAPLVYSTFIDISAGHAPCESWDNSAIAFGVTKEATRRISPLLSAMKIKRQSPSVCHISLDSSVRIVRSSQESSLRGILVSFGAGFGRRSLLALSISVSAKRRLVQFFNGDQLSRRSPGRGARLWASL